MKEFTLAQLAEFTGGEVIGDPQTKVYQVKPIEEAGPGAITFLANPKYARYLETTKASAVIVPGSVKEAAVPLLQAKDPYLAFAQILSRLHPTPVPDPGIHPSAVIGEGARLGENVYIGPQAVVGKNVIIGDGTRIFPGTVIGNNCQIGKDSVLHANVSVYYGVKIGNKVIIHSGTVIGSDGFGFVFGEGKQQKVPQVGMVIIDDEVEIGANVTIDRGTLGATHIGRYTKIDNLVQIAHNVKIGENSIIVAQTGIAGSTKVGNRVILGGQVGVAGHIQIADDTKVASKSGISKGTTPGAILGGHAAIPHQQWRKAEVAFRRLPKLWEKVNQLESVIKKIEKITEKNQDK